MHQQQLIKSGEKEIKYEFRFNRVLVMFTNFNDKNLTLLGDKLEKECTQVELTENILRYDENIGAIIITMVKGYNEILANKEIKNVFVNEFSNIKS